MYYFVITAVRYELNYKGNSVISYVKVSKVNRVLESFEESIVWTKEDVIKAKENNITVKTARKTNNNKLIVGAEVQIFKIYGIKYIRTDSNETEADNLGELEEF